MRNPITDTVPARDLRVTYLNGRRWQTAIFPAVGFVPAFRWSAVAAHWCEDHPTAANLPAYLLTATAGMYGEIRSPRVLAERARDRAMMAGLRAGCIHPGVFSTGAPFEWCPSCDSDVPATAL